MATYPIPVYRVPGQRSFYWQPELTTTVLGAQSGTAGKVSSLPVRFEPCEEVNAVVMRTPYEDRRYRNFVQSYYGRVRTTEHSQITVRCPVQASGLAMYSLASLAGDTKATGATETLSGGGSVPDIHTIIPGTRSTRVNPFHLWFNEAGTDNVIEFPFCVLQSNKLTFEPGQPIQSEMIFLGRAPQLPGDKTPTGANRYTGEGLIPNVSGYTLATGVAPLYIDNTMTFGTQGSWAFYDSQGTGGYLADLSRSELTIQRPVQVWESNNQQNQDDPLSPYDFLSGELQVMLSLNAIYTGLGHPDGNTGIYSAYYDYLKMAKLGSFSAQHSMKFTDTAKNSFAVSFFPAYWQDGFTVAVNGTALEIQGTLDSTQDPLSAVAYTPSVTTLVSMVFTNTIHQEMMIS